MRRGRSVFELTVAKVAVQTVVAVVSDQDIGLAIVVIVADADALGPTLDGKAGLSRNICKFPVAVVVVELHGARGARSWAFERSAVGDQNIVGAIAIVVKDGGAVAGRLQDVRFLVAAPECVGHGEAAGFGDVNQADGNRATSPDCDTQYQAAQKREVLGTHSLRITNVPRRLPLPLK